MGFAASPRRAAEQLYAALEADDVTGFLALCAEDVSFRYPAEGRLPYGGSWEGRGGVARFLEAHDEAEEIVSFQVHRMLAEGETVIVLGNFAGRAKPNGGPWSTQFVHHLKITGGLLRRWEAFYDSAAAVEAHARDSPTRHR